MPGTDALVMAAGSGARFCGEPKQYLSLRGRPMMAWAIERFSGHAAIDRVTVVVASGAEDQVRRLVEEQRLGKIHAIVPGGATRQGSVRLGLDALDSSSEKVLVHDAARPCLSSDLLQRIVDALSDADAVVPALPTVDTLIHESSGRLDAILDRVGISGVQTPQGFRTELLKRAHRNAESKGIVSSDDGSLVFALGEAVKTIIGERTNIKITFENDLPIAEAILGA